MSKEAIKLAIEALEPFKRMFREVEARHEGGITEANIHCQISVSDLRKCLYAFCDLEEALATEQEQRSDSEQLGEPVAWMTTEVTTGTQVWLYEKTASRYQNPPTPLYTTTQPKQKQGEPVAWGVIASNTGRLCQVELDFAEVEDLSPKWVMPLYTTPQQRKPLTDEQIEMIWTVDQTSADDCASLYYAKVIARAIEAAHGIKGEV